MRAVLTLLLAASAANVARGQPTEPPPADPVIAHFREYRAALERNDLPAAETAAAAALAVAQRLLMPAALGDNTAADVTPTPGNLS
jgi:hypothetical protein